MIVFGDFIKFIDFYNLFINIFDIAAFYPDFKLINTMEFFMDKIIQFIRH